MQPLPDAHPRADRPTVPVVQTRFVHVAHSPALEQAAREHGRQLLCRAPGLQACLVTVESVDMLSAPARYVVRVDARLPHQEMTACRLDGQDAAAAMARAFAGLHAQIDEYDHA